MNSQAIGHAVIKQNVRERYSSIAQHGGGCGGGTTSCCGGVSPAQTATHDPIAASRAVGYHEHELRGVPDGANLGLGCGNPQAIASLKTGETVLDLGSGAGFDAFLAARAVGESGSVIGVDMTPDMVAKARANAVSGNFENVEFRLGEIESLPLEDATVDAIISNCVINLSPDKPQVFKEAFRVLKPGGRLAISDIVALAPIPEPLRGDWELYTGCVTGASTVDEIGRFLRETGFTAIRISHKGDTRKLIAGPFSGRSAADYIASASIEAVKPDSLP